MGRRASTSLNFWMCKEQDGLWLKQTQRVARWNHVAIVPPNNGNLILIGGRDGSGPLASAGILDPESFLSSPLPDLLTPTAWN